MLPLSLSLRTRLEKAAVDNGFDLPLTAQEGWLGAASSLVPLRVWLGAVGENILLVAVSQPHVLRALGDHGIAFTHPLPPAAAGARGVKDLTALHRLLGRALQLSRALPDEPLRVFQQRTAGLPRGTEAERLVVQRVGQDIFRRGLLDYWESRCAVTSLRVPALLRASHIKPWADCADDAERLDVFNGLLLAAHLDAAFDAGLITVQDDGTVVVSDALDAEARGLLGLEGPARVRGLAEGHRRYLPWHRERVFQGG